MKPQSKLLPQAKASIVSKGKFIFDNEGASDILGFDTSDWFDSWFKDQGINVNDEGAVLAEKERIRTVIINLSTEDSFSGGDLYVGGDKIKYKQGKALSFYSSTVHEVTKITKGFRYSIALWLKKDNLKFYDPEKGPKPSLI